MVDVGSCGCGSCWKLSEVVVVVGSGIFIRVYFVSSIRCEMFAQHVEEARRWACIRKSPKHSSKEIHFTDIEKYIFHNRRNLRDTVRTKNGKLFHNRGAQLLPEGFSVRGVQTQNSLCEFCFGKLVLRKML